MILDLKKLKRSGKDQSDFFFEYQPEPSIMDIPGAEFKGVVKINGTISLTGEHSAFVEGEISFTVAADCTRCLKPTEREFIMDFDTSVGEDEDGYPVNNDTVDLSKIIDDTVAMNLPVSFLCDEDCKGLCPNCGVNLNDGECECKNK